MLIRNARIFIGDGRVIESGAVLVKNGKIERVYEGAAPDPKALKAEAIEAAGKTLLPGLIDMNVHLAARRIFGICRRYSQTRPCHARWRLIYTAASPR